MSGTAPSVASGTTVPNESGLSRIPATLALAVSPRSGRQREIRASRAPAME
jgi:hypothetical protein